MNEDGDSSGGEMDENEYYDSSSSDYDLLTLKKLREDYEAREGKLKKFNSIRGIHECYEISCSLLTFNPKDP